MTAEEKLKVAIYRALADYDSQKRSLRTRQGMAAARVRRMKEAREKLNNLLLEVEYDFIWHIVQHFLDTQDEKGLLGLIKSAEETLEEIERVENIFPPKPLEAKE